MQRDSAHPSPREIATDQPSAFLANELSGCCASQRSFRDHFVAIDAERSLDLVGHAIAPTENADRDLLVRVPAFSH